MTLRSAVVRSRLGKLREVVRNLELIRETPESAFVSDFRHHWLAERGLQLAAETVFDVGGHLLVAIFNVTPRDYEDVLEQLGRVGVLSTELRERMRGLGKFRNVLVHDYLEVDPGRIYAHLVDGLSDFVDFASQVEAFLAKHQP